MCHECGPDNDVGSIWRSLIYLGSMAARKSSMRHECKQKICFKPLGMGRFCYGSETSSEMTDRLFLKMGLCLPGLLRYRGWLRASAT